MPLNPDYAKVFLVEKVEHEEMTIVPHGTEAAALRPLLPVFIS